jgi:hypothetical protein
MTVISSLVAYLQDSMVRRRHHQRFRIRTHKVTDPYQVAMHKFPQSPKGLYNMDIIIVGVYNKEERKVSENSFLCSRTTILAMRPGRKLDSTRCGGGECGSEDELINRRRKHSVARSGLCSHNEQREQQPHDFSWVIMGHCVALI